MKPQIDDRRSPCTPGAGRRRASRSGARTSGSRRGTARSRRGSRAGAPRGASGGRSMGPACASAAARIATVPPLTTNVSSDPPSMTRHERGAERRSTPPGWPAARRTPTPTICAHVAGQDLVDVGAEQQHDEEDAADDRNGQQQLQRALRDELHGDEGPVRGGDERPALEGGLQMRAVEASTVRLYPLRYSAASVSPPDSTRLRDRRVSARRLLAAGLLADGDDRGGRSAVRALEIRRRPPRPRPSRVEAYVRRDFERMIDVLSRVASAIANDPAAAQGLAAGPDAARDLFDLIDRRLPEAAAAAEAIAVTIYRGSRRGGPGMGRAAVGHRSRPAVGSFRILRHPVAPRAAPGARPADWRPGRASPRLGRGRARALAGAGLGGDRAERLRAADAVRSGVAAHALRGGRGRAAARTRFSCAPLAASRWSRRRSRRTTSTGRGERGGDGSWRSCSRCWRSRSCC